MMNLVSDSLRHFPSLPDVTCTLQGHLSLFRARAKPGRQPGPSTTSEPSGALNNFGARAQDSACRSLAGRLRVRITVKCRGVSCKACTTMMFLQSVVHEPGFRHGCPPYWLPSHITPLNNLIQIIRPRRRDAAQPEAQAAARHGARSSKLT
jgi:hypothetical protein